MITLPSYHSAHQLNFKIRKNVSSRIEIGDYALIILLLWLGLFLRVTDLEAESLWVDEITSVELANSSLPQIIEDRSQSVNPPLYFIILHYWVYRFGSTEFAIRFLSVIFGTVTLPLIYQVGKLLANRQIGLFSAFLLTLSVFHISYAQEARPYTLMTMLSLVSIYCFVRLFNNQKRVLFIAYLLSSILLMYTHFYGLLIVLAQGIYFLLPWLFSERNLKLKQWLGIQGILVILYLPWVKFLITQLLVIQEGYWIPAPTLFTLLGTFREYSSNSNMLSACFLILAFFSVLTFKHELAWKAPFQALKNHLRSTRILITWQIYLLTLWLAVPIIIPFVLSQISTPIYYKRYTIAASLAFYILIAIGLQNIKNKYTTLITLVFVTLFSWGIIKQYYSYSYKAHWREAAHYLDDQAQPNDLLLFNEAGQSSIFAYYSQRTDLTLQGFDLEGRLVTEKTEADDSLSLEDLRPTVQNHPRVWLLLASRNDKEGLLKKELSQLYNLLEQKKFSGVEIYLFEKAQ